MFKKMRWENSEQNVFGVKMPKSMLPSARDNDDHGVNAELIEEYKHLLSGKAEGTIDAYLRTIRHIMIWVAKRSGNDGHFQS